MKTSTGIDLTTNEATKNLESYAHEKGLNTIRVFLATEKSGRQEYWLVDGTRPEFASQSYEDIAVHIDIMHLARGGFENG